MLRLAGREVQIVGFAPRIGGKGGTFEAAGTRFGEIVERLAGT